MPFSRVRVRLAAWNLAAFSLVLLATLGAAVYLCLKGPGLDTDEGLRRGYYSYNADQSYVNIVLGRTHNYDRVRFPPVPTTPPGR